MSHVLKHNVVDQIAFFRAYDTDGTAKTNLTSSTTGLSISVFRVGASSVSVSSLSDKAADDSTHSDGAIRNVGGNLYTIDLPDAATATQVPSIVVRGTYTGGVIEGLEHPVVAYDPAVNYASASKAADIETDTQDIQARLPAALVDGRMVSLAQVVSDKTGYKLASDGLVLVTDWTVDITGDLNGNVTGSVGSISGVTFPANFGLLGIDGGGVVLQVGTVDELGANALTANGAIDSISNIAVLLKLDSMIEADGADWRYTANALEQAPAGGGGGGGTDWTSDERTAIRSILGIPASGTTPTDPSVGILDEIRDDINSIGINVYPVSASTPERVAGTTLTFYRDESRSVSVVTDFTLTSLTLEFVVENADGVDVYTLADGSISRSNQTFTVSITTAVTGGLGQYRWSMRDVTGGGSSVIAMGVLTVQEAASNA
jgi:hypothetical protein